MTCVSGSINATTGVRVNGRDSKAFEMGVSVHQGSMLSPVLFVIVLEALSREFRKGYQWSCCTLMI